MQNLVKIGLSVAELVHIFDFQNGGRPPSWISWSMVNFPGMKATANCLLAVIDEGSLVLSVWCNG